MKGKISILRHKAWINPSLSRLHFTSPYQFIYPKDILLTVWQQPFPHKRLWDSELLFKRRLTWKPQMWNARKLRNSWLKLKWSFQNYPLWAWPLCESVFSCCNKIPLQNCHPGDQASSSWTSGQTQTASRPKQPWHPFSLLQSLPTPSQEIYRAELCLNASWFSYYRTLNSFTLSGIWNTSPHMVLCLLVNLLNLPLTTLGLQLVGWTMATCTGV